MEYGNDMDDDDDDDSSFSLGRIVAVGMFHIGFATTTTTSKCAAPKCESRIIVTAWVYNMAIDDAIVVVVVAWSMRVYTGTAAAVVESP